MSEIRWCDVGGHAFSMNEPGRKSYAATEYFDGDPRERIDICGVCNAAGKLGLKTLSIQSAEATPDA